MMNKNYTSIFGRALTGNVANRGIIVSSRLQIM